jgi:hypothetical protein
VEELKLAVQENMVAPHYDKSRKTMTREYIDWRSISQELGRVPVDCYNKWRLLSLKSLKRGRFTPEELELIRTRVEEWGDRGKGLFARLEKEMGRGEHNIRQRWLGVVHKESLSRKLMWTTDMVRSAYNINYCCTVLFSCFLSWH